MKSADDVARHLDVAYASGVTDVICAGTDPRLPEVVQTGAHSAVRIHRAFGIHPEHVDEHHAAAQLDALERRLGEDGVVAIGECGIDARPGMPDIGAQLDVFRAQV